MRKVRMMFSLLLSAAVLAACTSGETKTEIQHRTGISLSWWGNDGRHEYMMEGVDLFEKKNSSIDVSIRYGEWNGYETKTQVYMESGNETDVMLINYSWLSRYSPDGTGYYDLNRLSDYIDLSAFGEKYLEYGTVNGRLNALPTAMNTTILCYNKSMYDKYGLALPVTWDDLFAAAEVMKADGIYPLGSVKKHTVLILYSYYEQLSGKAPFDENGGYTLNAEDVASILTFYKRLIDEKVLCPVDEYDTSYFAAEQVAGTPIWVSDAGIYCSGLAEAGSEPVIGEYPMLPGAAGYGRYIKPSTMYAISADTEHPEEAAKLLDFLLNDEENALLTGTEKGVPISSRALKALQDNDRLSTYEYTAYEDMEDNIDKMSILCPSMENSDAIDAFKKGADEYLFDKMSLEEASELIVREVNAALE